MNSLYPDIPRVLTGIAEWSACIMFCFVIPQRRKPLRFAFESAVFLIILCAFLMLTDDVPLLLWIPCMLTAFAMMFIFLVRECEGHSRNLIYYAMRAFLLAEFAASFNWQLACYNPAGAALSAAGMDPSAAALPDAVIYGISLVIYAVIFLIALYIENRLSEPDVEIHYTWKDLALTAATVLITFAISNLSFVVPISPFSSDSRADIFMIRTFVDLAGLAILYIFQSRVQEFRTTTELQAIDAMLSSQYENYRSYQEMIDLINFK